jgi:hypothetical protein
LLPSGAGSSACAELPATSLANFRYDVAMPVICPTCQMPASSFAPSPESSFQAADNPHNPGGLRGLPGIQLGAQTFYLQVVHQVVVAGVIAVAPQRGPSFDVGGIEAIGPHHRNLVMLEHPVEPAPLGGATFFGTPTRRHISFHRCTKVEFAVRASTSSRASGNRNFWNSSGPIA